MRKALLALAGILLLAAGGAIGWFAAKRGTAVSQPGSPPGKPAIFYRADKGLLIPAPSWEEWRYPNSRTHFTSTGGGSKAGEIEFSESARIALVTRDDFEKVWAFYKNKCKLRNPDDGSRTSRFEYFGNEQAVTLKLFDDIQAHTLEGPKSEAVQARGFSVQSPRYSLVGFVYRPKGSDSISILMVYRPNTEFLGLLKEKLVKD